MTREYFKLGLSVSCSLGAIACRAKGSLPVYPLRRGKGWGRDTGKVCPLLVLAPPHPLPHLEVLSLNHQQPKLDGLKRSLTQLPTMELGTLKGREWPKVTEQGRVTTVTGKGSYKI